jgi:membrane-bound serine protease (ClpP class)
MKRAVFFLACFAVCILSLTFPQSLILAQDESPLVLALKVDGTVTPAMAEYLDRGIKIAAQRNAELLIFEMNTPGGSVDIMNRMVQSIRGSSVPVVVYVSPRGAMAGSAGTVITLAGHIAAMAPETAIGAASPVGSQGEDIGQTMESKVKEILKATVRSLAERRGETAIKLAQDTIETAKAVSVKEAKEAGLIDFIAADTDDLIRQLDGYQVETASGLHTLHLSNAETVTLPNTLIEQVLQLLTNPNIVFILLSIGVQAILIELSSPGGWVSGFIGVICIALAIYGLGILPVNWFGLIFLVLAFILFIVDIKAPTHGALTAAGVGSLIVGGLVLFNSPNVPSFQRVSVPLVIGMSVFTGALFFLVLMLALRAQRVPIRAGMEAVAGRMGVARSAIDPEGMVQAAGELWSAELIDGEEPVAKGERVEVVEVEGIKLRVRKIKSS